MESWGTSGFINQRNDYEPDGDDDDHEEEILSDKKLADIFTVSRVEFEYVLEKGIKQVVCVSEWLFIVTSNSNILIYNDDRKVDREIVMNLKGDRKSVV